VICRLNCASNLSRRVSEWFTLTPILADSGNAAEGGPFGAAWSEAAKTSTPERSTTVQCPTIGDSPARKPR
jgi:hypothetical protein